MGEQFINEVDNTQQDTDLVTDTSRSNSRIARFLGFGWKVRLQHKRTSHFLTLVKELVLGNALRTGDELYYYLVECEGRKAVLVFLDKLERPEAERVRVDGVTFLVKR